MRWKLEQSVIQHTTKHALELFMDHQSRRSDRSWSVTKSLLKLKIFSTSFGSVSCKTFAICRTKLFLQMCGKIFKIMCFWNILYFSGQLLEEKISHKDKIFLHIIRTHLTFSRGENDCNFFWNLTVRQPHAFSGRE